MGGGVMGGGQPAGRPTGRCRVTGRRRSDPPLLDDLRVPGHRPAASYTPIPDYPISKHLRVAAWPAAPEYPAVPHYLSVRGHPPVPDWPAAPAVGYRALPRRLARPMRRHAADAAGAGRRFSAT